MTIRTVDELIAALPGQYLPMLKLAAAAQVAGQFYSPWLLGGRPSAGAVPSSGVAGDVPTKDTPGSFPFVNAVSPKLNYLARLTAFPNAVGVLILYDRLWHNSGLSPTSLVAQTVNSVPLPVRTPGAADATGELFDGLGEDVEAWFQVYDVAMGAGSTPPTISYVNSDGVSGRTGTAQGFVASAAIGRAFPFSLASGDRGVRSIETYTNAATLTSGTFGLVLRRRLAAVQVPLANVGQALDWAALGLPVIPSDACLEFLWLAQTTTAASLMADMQMVSG